MIVPVISYVDEHDFLLYSEFTELAKEDQPLDYLYSRNRSFSKKVKRENEVFIPQENNE